MSKIDERGRDIALAGGVHPTAEARIYEVESQTADGVRYRVDLSGFPWSCNCPYSRGGQRVCKHIAAAHYVMTGKIKQTDIAENQAKVAESTRKKSEGSKKPKKSDPICGMWTVYELKSALQKYVRRGDPRAVICAVAAAEVHTSDILRRLPIIAMEDGAMSAYRETVALLRGKVFDAPRVGRVVAEMVAARKDTWLNGWYWPLRREYEGSMVAVTDMGLSELTDRLAVGETVAAGRLAAQMCTAEKWGQEKKAMFAVAYAVQRLLQEAEVGEDAIGMAEDLMFRLKQGGMNPDLIMLFSTLLWFAGETLGGREPFTAGPTAAEIEAVLETARSWTPRDRSVDDLIEPWCLDMHVMLGKWGFGRFWRQYGDRIVREGVDRDTFEIAWYMVSSRTYAKEMPDRTGLVEPFEQENPKAARLFRQYEECVLNAVQTSIDIQKQRWVRESS